MPLVEHLRELRTRLVKSGLAIVAGMVVGWIYYTQLFALLARPFENVVAAAQAEGRNVTLALTGVADPFVLQVQIAAWPTSG
jgi:Sec-independent protein secretion pathway component TatC